jgi:hypothetical protein
MTTPIPNVQHDAITQAALDLEPMVRHLAQTYSLSTAQQLYALVLVQKALLRSVLDVEQRKEKDER